MALPQQSTWHACLMHSTVPHLSSLHASTYLFSGYNCELQYEMYKDLIPLQAGKQHTLYIWCLALACGQHILIEINMVCYTLHTHKPAPPSQPPAHQAAGPAQPAGPQPVQQLSLWRQSRPARGQSTHNQQAFVYCVFCFSMYICMYRFLWKTTKHRAWLGLQPMC